MKIFQRFIFLILFCIILSSFSFGLNWFQETNSGLNLPGGSGFTGYGYNYPNQLAPNYTSCGTEGSTTNALAFDVDNDGFEDILFANGVNLYAYDRNCNLLTSYVLPYAPTVLTETNVDTDTYPEITAVLNGNSIYTFEYDAVLGTWNILSNVTSNGGIYSFGCKYQAEINDAGNLYTSFCVGISQTYSQSFQITSSLDHAIVSGWSFTNVTQLNSKSQPASSGLSGIYMTFSDDGTGTEKAFQCGVHTISSVNLKVGCNGFNYTGGNTSVNWQSPNSDTANGWFYSQAYYAKVRGTMRILSSLDFRLTSFSNIARENAIYDINGNRIFLNTSTPSAPLNDIYLSNWMVADYDKNGQSEACFLNATMILHCLNAAGTILYKHDFSIMGNSTVTNIKGIGMADFVKDNQYMGLISDNGIYYYNTTTQNVTAVFNSDNISSTHYTGDVITAFAGSLTPLAFSASTTLGRIITNPTVSTSCGNGICESFENAFICAADCGQQSATGTCVTDSDCKQPYPTCLNNKCIAGYTGIPCVDSTYCPINASVCYNNFCIQGVFGGINNTIAAENLSSAAIGTDMDAIWRLIFDGSALWRLVFGIILCIVVIIFFYQIASNNGQHDVNPMIVAIIIGGTLTLFTLTFLISKWVILLLIIIAAAVLIVNGVWKKTTSEG